MRIRRRVVALAVVVIVGGAWLICQDLLFRREVDKRIAELKEQVGQMLAALDERTKIREELVKQEKEGMAARCGGEQSGGSASSFADTISQGSARTCDNGTA